MKKVSILLLIFSFITLLLPPAAAVEEVKVAAFTFDGRKLHGFADFRRR